MCFMSKAQIHDPSFLFHFLLILSNVLLTHALVSYSQMLHPEMLSTLKMELGQTLYIKP